MYGPQVLGASVPVGAAAVLPATGNNSALFIAAGVLFVAGVVTMIVSKLKAVKG
jgi:LPXTG-motif cell wall-anchored protein